MILTLACRSAAGKVSIEKTNIRDSGLRGKMRELKRARLGSVNMMMNEQIDGPSSAINLNANKSLGTSATLEGSDLLF